MQNNEPTPPQPIGYEPDAVTDPGTYSEAPTWPPAAERSPRPLAPERSALLWVSIGATGVALSGLLAVLLLNQLGVFALRGASGPVGPNTALSSPTATSAPTATTSTLPLASPLQVTPGNVRLGCDGGEQVQVIVLANSGPKDLEWQVLVDGSRDQAGIAITPNLGSLAAGDSVSVQLANTTQSSTSQDGGHREGVIQFEPTTTAAGSPASLSYRLDFCH